MKKKSAPEKLATKIPRRIPGQERLTRLFGPPPLLEGEDVHAYNVLLARIFSHIGPVNILEEIWVRDFVDLTWDLFRLRRLKATFLNHRAYGKRLPVKSFIDIPPEDKMIKPGPRTQPSDAVKQVFLATALADNLDDIYRIEQMSASIEVRRNAILREIDRHRQSLGKALRAADQAVDAEYQVITSDRLNQHAA